MIKEVDHEGSIFNSRANEFGVKSNIDFSSKLAKDLVDTLRTLQNRYFLCSNEIGYTQRAFAIKFSDSFMVFMNPVFQSKDGIKLIREHDVLTNKDYIIPRYTKVILCYQDKKGNILANKFDEDPSIVICQAMDILDNLHDEDYGLEIIPEFDEATPEERQEVIQAYLEHIQEAQKELDKELREDTDMAKLWQQYRFLTARARGEIEFDTEEEDQENKEVKEDIKVKLMKPEIELPMGQNREQRRFFGKLSKKMIKKGK